MCGLIGSYGAPLNRSAALRLIAHRGPDGSGWWTDGTTTLGHTRLAIQDVSEAAGCPFTSGPVTLTYNGEIWNADELRTAEHDPDPLGGPRPWRTTGDTEVVARQISRFGYRGLDRLDGMFALAWHDSTTTDQRGGTWLARDRWGKIPLYAVRHRNQWRWASELKALPHGVPAVAVAPGTAVHLPSGRIYHWATAATPQEPTPATIALLLREGVRKRLVSDRPLAFLLSGGLDSTMVLASALNLGVTDAHAYTAVHDPASPDTQAARRVARELGVPLTEVKVPDPDRAAIREAVRAVEVPMKAQVEIALGCLPLARAIASDGYRVVLSGEAADEIFGGYGNMAIAAARADDAGWREIRSAQLAKMARGNFIRVNKIFMAAGIEARLPFMERALVATALAAGKKQCPPGKALLKAAATGQLPQWVIHRPKDTFQGASGLNTAAARAVSNPGVFYNNEARRAFGYLPRG